MSFRSLASVFFRLAIAWLTRSCMSFFEIRNGWCLARLLVSFFIFENDLLRRKSKKLTFRVLTIRSLRIIFRHFIYFCGVKRNVGSAERCTAPVAANALVPLDLSDSSEMEQRQKLNTFAILSFLNIGYLLHFCATVWLPIIILL